MMLLKKPATKLSKYFSGVTRDTFLLASVSLFADIATEMLYPILPIFLTQTLRANGAIVGLVEGIANATQNIVQGFAGYISDKIQRRKYLAIVGYLISALSKPLIGFSTIWQQVLGIRFLDRLGTGTRSAPRDALIAGSVDEKDKGKAFGLEGIGDNLGAFLGPLFAIFLLFSLKIPIRNIFYIALIPGLLSVAAIILVRERKSVQIEKTKLNVKFRSFGKSYWKYLLATAVFGIGASSSSFLILATRDIGISLQTTIFIYAFFNLAAALVSYPSGALSDKFGRKNILIFSFLIFFISYLGFALTRSYFVIAFLFILYGVYQGIFRGVGKALASDLVPFGLRASGIGWYSATVGLTSLFASIIAGQVWDKIGHPAVFIFGSIFAVAGSIAMFVLVKRDS